MAAARPLPDFLRTDFEEEALEASRSSIAAVVASGEVVWINDAWRRREGEYGLADTTVGLSYFQAIAPPLRTFFEEAFAGALESRAVFELDYDCTSPTEQRIFRLRVLPIDRHGWLVEHSLLVAKDAPPPTGPAVRDAYRNVHGIITQCGNCRRTLDPATKAWHWIPDFLVHMDSRVSHGLCPSCSGFFWGTKLRRPG